MPDSEREAFLIDSLYRISSLVNDTEDPKEAFQLILEELMRVMRASSASIALINPDTNSLEIEAHLGLKHDTDQLSLPLGFGITGWVALHGKPLLIPDVREDPRYIAFKKTIRSEMAVPMLLRGDPVGVVNVDSEQPDAFNENDLKLLTLLTNEATKVVNRLWLIRKLKEKADQLQSIIDIGQQLVAKRDTRYILDSITEQGLRLMGCRLCAILLLTPDNRSLRLQSIAGASGSMDYNEELLLEDSSVGVAIQRKKQVSVFNMAFTEEHHFVPLVQQEGLVSLLATPILFEDEVIGVLNAYTDKPHRFTNDEKRIFSSLASLGAVAIQNARLYHRVFSSEESLRKNERLTTLGLLAAEIAHEIRNPLTVIKLLFDSLDLDYQADEARQRDVSIIREKINQLEEIVGRVLNFGKSRHELHARFDLRQLVEDTLHLVRLKMEQSGLTLEYHAPEQPLFVNVHKGQIQQVVLNLVLNAMQAMPSGGRIAIQLSSRTSDTQQSQAVFRIQDHGSGMPPEIANTLFESFLTNRKEGTGLGLAISKRILKSHRGNIELIDTGPSGSCFEFWLPQIHPTSKDS